VIIIKTQIDNNEMPNFQFTFNPSALTTALEIFQIKEIAYKGDVRSTTLKQFLSNVWKKEGWWILVKGAPLTFIGELTWGATRAVVFKQDKHPSAYAEFEEQYALVPLLVKETIKYPFRSALYRYLSQDAFQKYNHFWDPLAENSLGLFAGYPLHVLYVALDYTMRKYLTPLIHDSITYKLSDDEVEARKSAIGLTKIVSSILFVPLQTIVVKTQINSDRRDISLWDPSIAAQEIFDQKGYYGFYFNGWSSILLRTLFKQFR
jgi:hypothetical protein